VTGFVRPVRDGAHHAYLRSPFLTLLGLLLAIGAVAAGRGGQPAYKYRDADGHWVFTDQAPPEGVHSDALALKGQPDTRLNIAAIRYEDANSVQLVGLNDCLCVITLELTILKSEVEGLPVGATLRAVIEPRTRKTLMQAPRPTRDSQLEFRWSASLGSPDAQHQPSTPYRVPYGIGSSFRVSQAYPSRLTHTLPENFYAIDFALPDGTPVYAAREGLVINARHDHFKGAADPLMLDQANVVQILHSDGTIAVYAHLHWDSIRVHIGEHVTRGQYIANSGSTGFSSGPHLHFAVTRNTGEDEISVPVEFVGPGGQPVAAVDQTLMTAY
jgi:murein DD-endopeptidase MepM/ murein hydrolase activator NlpD